eukprot:3757625-Ditylum_brightwellii.AAC.1
MINDNHEPKPPPWPGPNINTAHIAPLVSNPSYSLHRFFKQTTKRNMLNSAKLLSTTTKLEATSAKCHKGKSLDLKLLTQSREPNYAAAYDTYLLQHPLPDDDSLDHAPIMSFNDAPDYDDEDNYYNFLLC